MIQLSEKMQEIRCQIISDDIKVVSFDIFDTLLLRPCTFPTDMFKIVAKRIEDGGTYCEIRRIAEYYARKKKPFYHDDITIDDIYKEYMELTGISNNEAQKIKECEIQVEMEYLYPRYSVKELYDAAITAGKKVIICSDMYLSKEVLEKILTKNNYLDYTRLYVSSEEKLSKGSGRLFQRIIADFQMEGIEASEIIHMGDNMSADVVVPKRLGINAIHLPNASGILNSKAGLKPLRKYCNLTDNCFLVGVLANYLFDDPYFPFNTESISGGYEKLLGGVLYGPLLFLYMKWVIEECIDNNIKELLFVYRDGYVLEKIFEFISKEYNTNIKTKKIYLSRTIRYYFFAEEKLGIINTLGDFPIPSNMTVREFLQKRLLLEEEEDIQKAWEIFMKYGYISLDSLMGKKEQYLAAMCETSKIFEKKAKDDIDNIVAYCQSIIDSSEKIGVLDVGYRGSVGKFLRDKFNIHSNTYQIFANPKCECNIKKYKVNSFYSNGFQSIADMKILHHLTEDMISIQEGTACKVTMENNIFRIHKEESVENNTISEMQKGILEFVEYAVKYLKYDFKDMYFDKTIFIDILYDFFKKPYRRDAVILTKLVFNDANFVRDKENQNIYSVWFNSKFGTEKTVKKLVENVEEGVTSEIVENSDKWIKIGDRVVSKNHYRAIKICDKLHILKYVVKLKKIILRRKRKEISENTIENVFSKPYIEAVEKINILERKNNIKEKIIIAGAIANFDKGTCNYVNKMAEILNKTEFVLLSEANPKATEEKICFSTIMVPEFLYKDKFVSVTGCICSKKIKKIVKNKKHLMWAVDNMLERHKNMELDYAYLWSYYAELYIRKALTILSPKYILLWNEFYAYHHIFKAVCKELNIKIYYLEFGSLPGTFSIECLGQMGESFPGKKNKEFMKFPLKKNDISEAINVLDYMKNSKINRNIQPINNNINSIKSRLKKDRPTILYAGVNDYESGLFPYTENTQKYHSPYIKSSYEGAKIIAEIAKRNNWNFIYKPHPRIEIISPSNTYDFDENVIIANSVDINEVIEVSDVIVTILSQVSYTALINEKATVMLGYTQLKGKGCCYEAFSEDQLESSLVKAIKNGMTKEQKEAFIKHVAQMLKYNLYDDLNPREIRYGQEIQKAANYLENYDNTVEWYLEN